MKKTLLAILLGLCGAIPLCAQSTTVSVTVVDQTAQAWANGTISYTFSPTPGIPGPFYWGGAIVPVQYMTPITVALDGSGSASFSVPTNTAITPSGSGWLYNVCPNASAKCVQLIIPAAGSTQNISAAVTAVLKALQVNAANLPKAYSDSEVVTVPAQGGTYYNVLGQAIRYFNGSVWANLAGSGVITAVTGTPPVDCTTSGSSVNCAMDQSVTNFGAVGNGIADDTAAINSALTHMSTNGGCLYFPPGTYKTTAELDWVNQYAGYTPKTLCIRGDGRDSTAIIYEGTSTIDATIHVSNVYTSAVAPKVDIRDITLASNVHASYAFHLITCYHCNIENVTFEGGSVSSFEGDAFNMGSIINPIVTTGLAGSSNCVNGITLSYGSPNNGPGTDSLESSSQTTIINPVTYYCSGIGLNLAEAESVTIIGGQSSSNHQNVYQNCNLPGGTGFCNFMGVSFNQFLDEGPAVPSQILGSRNILQGYYADTDYPTGGIIVGGYYNLFIGSQGSFQVLSTANQTSFWHGNNIWTTSTDAGTNTNGYTNQAQVGGAAGAPWDTILLPTNVARTNPGGTFTATSGSTVSNTIFFDYESPFYGGCSATGHILPTWNSSTGVVTFSFDGGANGGSISCTNNLGRIISQSYPGTGSSPQTVTMSTQFHNSGAGWTEQNGTHFYSELPTQAGAGSTDLNGSGVPEAHCLADGTGGGVCGTSTPAFSAITSATNTTAAMVVGSGASLGASGTGTINATALNGATFASPGPIGFTTPNTSLFTSVTSGTLNMSSQCVSIASPAACASASQGFFIIAAGSTSVTVNTTHTTGVGTIAVYPDTSIGSALGVTCNTTLASIVNPVITARTAGTSFTVSIPGTLAVNPGCYSYTLIN
jgi:hypothetical protein